jgi:predicted RNA-binding Zn ribbon-like protein
MNEWLRRSLSAHIPHATPDDLKRVTELRARIRAAFLSAASGQAPVAASISELNRAAAADPGAPQLIWVDRSPRVVWAGSDAGGAHGVLASVARDAIAVLASGAVMRQCAAPDCDRLFIPDHGRRIWCSTSCGNRVRGSRHYALNKKVGTRPDG